MSAHNDDTGLVWLKLAAAWAGAVWGAVTLQNVVLLATLVFTLLQIYVLWRDRIKGKQ